MARTASRHTTDRPIALAFEPSRDGLPVEVLTRADVRRRGGAAQLRHRQRADFHQLILCSGGEGVHHVDYEPVSVRVGTLLHIYPGQVQEFQIDPHFDADMVVYRSDLHRTFIPGEEWFPGSGIPTRWNLDFVQRELAVASIRELSDEQQRFDGSAAYAVLMESLLAALLARLHLLVGNPTPVAQLPEPFVRLRRHVEEHMHSRPTIKMCATELGYSTRTLDRACQAAVGQTAKDVLDERVAFEIRRLLTHTDLGITRIGAMFGFVDGSSFSKFAQRHLGATPTEVRRAATSDGAATR